ncbi:MAG TPA: hypothetical protein VD794_11145, partial [Flavisolibacter sp.]|nr:hypothetical protein [Flavisolibacter sp.]
MRIKMSPSVYFGFLCCVSVLIVNFACQKKQNASLTETIAPTVHSVFNKNVGGLIDSATGNRWKRNLSNSLSKQTLGHVTSREYYLPAVTLRNLITEDKVAGVCFYYGKDSYGKVHLVPVAVDVRGSVVTAASVGTSNGSVQWDIAKQWRMNFKQQHPRNIWGHFWGTVAINRLLASGTETVRIELGQNDEGAQQIMFSDAAEAEPTEYGDRTRVCPP